MLDLQISSTGMRIWRAAAPSMLSFDSLCLRKKVTSRTPSGTRFRRIVKKP